MEALDLGRPRHRAAAGSEVRLDPVVRFVEATGAAAASIRTDRLPVTSTSLWTRSEVDDPDEVPLRLHFDVKAASGYDHAVIVGHRTEVRRPSRLGDLVGSHQVLRSIGPVGPTPLGPGRRWQVDLVLSDADEEVIQVETFTALGYRPGGPVNPSVRPEPRSERGSRVVGPAAPLWWSRTIAAASAACRVWAPVHHDPDAARRAGLPGVIAATQHLVAIVEHAVGSLWDPGSIGSLDLRLRRPVTVGPAPEVAVEWGRRGKVATVRLRQAGVVCCEAAVCRR